MAIKHKSVKTRTVHICIFIHNSYLFKRVIQDWSIAINQFWYKIM
ncbi:MAG TPA: hypothetical protein [Caudoviricetes sp.]|nr:MAG TPA: hypothetical protein [Caudoviricetes sp.]